MVTKRHKRGRLSSAIDRNRVKFAERNGKLRKNNIAQDGTQVFIHTGDFEEE